jgi:prepilin-type N-terminal cleavage/methylation domain-containing protein
MRAPVKICQGFTLIELIVVIALVSGLTVILIGGLRDNKSAALRNAQADVANFLAAARTKALASGCRVRVLIHADVNNPARFRRMLVLQQESTSDNDGTDFSTTSTVMLPESVIVLPYKLRIPSGLYAKPSAWTKTYAASGGNELHSSMLAENPLSVAVLSDSVESWDYIQFTPNDTLSSGHGGDIVLATVTKRPPSDYTAGQSPVRAESPDDVRGVSISTYGIVAFINSRSGF